MVMSAAWNIVTVSHLSSNPHDIELVYDDFHDEFSEKYPDGYHDKRYVRYQVMVDNLVEYFTMNYQSIFQNLAQFANGNTDCSLLFHGYDHLTGNLFLDKIGVFR